MITPDSAGSKGDEALIRGALSVFNGANITLLTTDRNDLSWKSELLDICNTFQEEIVEFEDISSAIRGPTNLVIIGADVIDGTCGILPSISRLDAVSKNNELGGRTDIFCSFRPDVNLEIAEKIKDVSGYNVYWHLRDVRSLENLSSISVMNCDYFPDFSYYCKKTETKNTDMIISKLNENKLAGKMNIGLNLSQHSYESFYGDDQNHSDEYVNGLITLINDTVPNAQIILITHDIRVWEGKKSDYD